MVGKYARRISFQNYASPGASRAPGWNPGCRIPYIIYVGYKNILDIFWKTFLIYSCNLRMLLYGYKNIFCFSLDVLISDIHCTIWHAGYKNTLDIRCKLQMSEFWSCQMSEWTLVKLSNVRMDFCRIFTCRNGYFFYLYLSMYIHQADQMSFFWKDSPSFWTNCLLFIYPCISYFVSLDKLTIRCYNVTQMVGLWKSPFWHGRSGHPDIHGHLHRSEFLCWYWSNFLCWH